MKGLIFCLIFLMMIGFFSAQSFEKYYKIGLGHEGGDFELLSLNIEFTNNILENDFSFYLAKVLSFENLTLNWTVFNVPNTILNGTIDENGTIVGGLLILNETNFTIYVPYYENAKEIVIYDENLTEKLRIDVGMYSKEDTLVEGSNGVEGDAKTGGQEKGGYESDKEKPKTFSEKLTKNWWILVLVLVILLIVLFIEFKKR